MNDRREAWRSQFDNNLGVREVNRLGIASIAWLFLGVALAITLHYSGLILLFLLTVLAFAMVSRRWKPAYSILLWIANNEDLPAEPMPSVSANSSLKREWWSFLPSIWWLLIDLLLLLAALGYFSRK